MVSEQVATFQIIAPEYLAKLIASCPTRDGFLKAIEEYKKAMPGRSDGLTRDKLEKWIAYCRLVCLTPVDPADGIRDIRWEVFLLYGIPTGWWVLPGELAIKTLSPSEQFKFLGDVTYYIYSWPGDVAIILHSDTLDGYPTRVASPLRTIPNRALPIYPIGRVVSLFNEKGGCNSFLVVWVRADQINKTTFENRSLTLSLKVWDSVGHPVWIPNNTATTSLAVYEKIAKVAWNLRGFPIDFAQQLELSPGKYKAEVRVGSSSNAGAEKFEFEIPRPGSIGVSEPVVTRGNHPKGSLATGAIKTSDGKELSIQPDLTFRRGSSSLIRASVRVPKSDTYRVTCDLIPFSDKANAESRATLMSSTGNLAGNFGGSPGSSLNIHIENQTDVEFKVDFNVPNGFYFLKVEATNPDRTQWIGKPSWVKVEVRESVL
ncbi:MAG: hypothetical protein AAB738_02620 [Patescibacteria group bacterium]